MAEGIFKKLIAEDDTLKDITVISAGTSVYLPGGATLQAIEAVSQLGVDIREHRAKPITEELINNADLILTMTGAHKVRVLSMAPEAQEKTFTLKEFADPKGEDLDISDPFGLSIEEYKNCAKDIESEMIKVKDKIKEMRG